MTMLFTYGYILYTIRQILYFHICIITNVPHGTFLLKFYIFLVNHIVVIKAVINHLIEVYRY